MRVTDRARAIVGLVLHVLVGGVMILAGSGKAFGFAPEEIVKTMTGYGLGDQIRLIGAGELASAVLMLIPRTRSLGVLLTSAFWGGVICIHLEHEGLGAVVAPSVLLILTWAGAFLRDPAILGSFRGRPAAPTVEA